MIFTWDLPLAFQYPRTNQLSTTASFVNLNKRNDLQKSVPSNDAGARLFFLSLFRSLQSRLHHRRERKKKDREGEREREGALSRVIRRASRIETAAPRRKRAGNFAETVSRGRVYNTMVGSKVVYPSAHADSRQASAHGRCRGRFFQTGGRRKRALVNSRFIHSRGPEALLPDVISTSSRDVPRQCGF